LSEGDVPQFGFTLMADNAVYTGSLLKYKSWMRWSSKNFVLTSEALTYSSASRSEGFCHLKNIVVHNDGGNSFNIVNRATSITMYLKAPSLEEKTEWINAINQQIANILYSGSLKKWTNVIKGWQQRYVILYKDRLCYYLNEESVGMRRGTIYLMNRKVSVTRSGTKFGFDVISSDTNTTWYLKATSEDELLTWTSKIYNRKLLNIALGDESGLNCRAVSSWSLNSTASKQEMEVDSDGRVLPSAPPPPASRHSSVIEEDSDQESSYRKDLECTICLELLHEPTTLTCGHSFCRDCLSNLWAADRSRFSCPACRHGINSVPAVNIALQNLIPVLYDNEEVIERTTSGNREAFDNFFSNPHNASSSSTQGGDASGRAYNHTNLEYEFLKRGMCLIFILWVGSKIISPFMPVIDVASSDSANQPVGDQEDNPDNVTAFLSLNSRRTLIFLLVGAIQCPRFLGAYIVLFWYSSLFFPSLKIVSVMFNQTLGFGLQLKVMIWGAVVPHIWLIPLFVHEQQYVLAIISIVISGIECWELFFFVRQIFHLQHDREQYVMSAMKRESGVSLMRLLFARAISYLPWGWLPDVLYYVALLLVTGEMMSKYTNRVRGLLDRTRALGVSSQIPGVQISNVSLSLSGEMRRT